MKVPMDESTFIKPWWAVLPKFLEFFICRRFLDYNPAWKTEGQGIILEQSDINPDHCFKQAELLTIEIEQNGTNKSPESPSVKNAL